MKQIYLIQSIEDGLYKIGIAKNPKLRIKQLQTGNSSQLKLIDTYSSEYASKIERTLHRRFRSRQKVGEWFELNLEFEVEFQKNCKQIEDNLEFLKNNSTLNLKL